MEYILLAFGCIAILIIVQMIKIVPQQQAWIIEKLGKFDKVLQPGLNLLIPLIQKVAYKHTLKEEAINVTAQTAISNDNVTLSIDGVYMLRLLIQWLLLMG